MVMLHKASQPTVLLVVSLLFLFQMTHVSHFIGEAIRYKQKSPAASTSNGLTPERVSGSETGTNPEAGETGAAASTANGLTPEEAPNSETGATLEADETGLNEKMGLPEANKFETATELNSAAMDTQEVKKEGDDAEHLETRTDDKEGSPQQKPTDTNTEAQTKTKLTEQRPQPSTALEAQSSHSARSTRVQNLEEEKSEKVPIHITPGTRDIQGLPKTLEVHSSSGPGAFAYFPKIEDYPYACPCDPKELPIFKASLDRLPSESSLQQIFSSTVHCENNPKAYCQVSLVWQD